MSKLQIKKVKSLQARILDFEERLEFKCFDCEGQNRHGPGWDCEMTLCPFYNIRPKTVFYKKQISRRFWPSVFSLEDCQSEKQSN